MPICTGNPIHQSSRTHPLASEIQIVSIQAGVPGKADFIVHSNQRVVIDNVLPCRAAATFSPGDDNPLLFCYGISNFTVRAIP